MASSPDKMAPYATPEETTALTMENDLERQKLGGEESGSSSSVFPEEREPEDKVGYLTCNI